MNVVRNTRHVAAAAAFAAALLGATVAQAFQLLPMAMEFAPAGAEATQTFALNNDAAEAVAVQVFVVKREVALDGTEVLTPAEQDFLVFPAQTVVQPGKAQLVQVRWIGTRAPGNELSYRLIAEQLPVNLNDRAQQGGRIDILMRYEGALYVTPAGVAPNVVVESVAAVQTAEGPKLAVVVENRGTAHGILRDSILTVSGRGTDGRTISTDLREKALGTLAGANVLAGARRQFLLPWPAALERVELTASLTTAYQN